MALIRRIEIANHLDSSRIPNQWNPDFRFLTFELNGQSTAVLMVNGLGKTTIANAILLLLTRHKGLAGKVKKSMSPSQYSSYSHIRIEIVQPQATPTGDMFAHHGMEVTGETWVYGVCGHRDSDGLSYYYYPGRLEDCPVGYAHSNQKVELYTNSEFAIKRQNVLGFKWAVSEEDQLRSLQPHFSTLATRRMLDFHLAGGGDKSADLYPVKPRKGDRGDESLFYNVLAPELICGVNDKEAEVGEDSFEKTILIGATRYVGAKIQSEGKKKNLEALRQSLEKAQPLRESGNTLLEKKQWWDDVKKEANFELIVLKKLVDDNIVPGIPKFHDDAEDILTEIVATPDSNEVLVLDRGLASITGATVSQINELAMRNNKTGISLRNMVGSAKNLRLPSLGGNFSKGYSREYAVFIVKKRLGSGLEADAAVACLTKAFRQWAVECDTNPYRKKLAVLTAEHSQKELHSEGLSISIGTIKTRLGKIADQIGELEKGKTAWDAINDSGFFSPEEISDPKKAGENADNDYAKANKRLNSHKERKIELEYSLSAWNFFCSQFSSDANPQSVLIDLKQRYTELTKKCDDAEHLKDNAEKVSLHAIQWESDARERFRQAENKRNKFTDLIDGVDTFKNVFAGESPLGLEEKVSADLNRFNSRVHEVEKTLASLNGQCEDLEKFRSAYPGEIPSKRLTLLEEEETKKQIEQGKATRELENLKTRLLELAKNRTSPRAAASDVMDLLQELSPVHLIDHLNSVGLSDPRRLKLLTLFSNHLFAPVLPTPEAAGKASEILERDGNLSPVFVGPTLTDFSSSDTTNSLEEGKVVFNYQAGVRTLTVEAVFDPQKIVLLRVQTQEALTKAEEKQASISGGIKRLGNEIFAVKKAVNALKAGADERYNALLNELRELKNNEETTLKRASSNSLNAIKAMVAYLDLGGDEGQQQTITVLKDVLLVLKKAEEENQQAQNGYEEARLQWKKLREGLGSFNNNEFSDTCRAMLNKAVEFVQKGGPEFMSTTEQVEMELSEPIANADRKRRFQFTEAAKFTQVGGARWKELHIQKKGLDRDFDDKNKEKDALFKDIDQIRKESTKYRDLKVVVDHLAAELLKHYAEKVPALGDLLENNFMGLDVMRDKGRTTLLLDTVFAFAKTVQHNGSVSAVQNSTSLVEDAFDDLNKIAGKTQKAKQAFDNEQAIFLREIGRFLDLSPGGVTTHELNTIREKKDEDVSSVLRLFNALDEKHKTEAAFVEDLIKSESKERSNACERLSMMAADARTHLTLFRKILSKTPQSTFLVSADVLPEEGIREVMAEILVYVEREELKKREFEKSASQIEMEQILRDDHRKKTLNTIRDWVYRNIFTNIKVEVVHPEMAAGRPLRYGVDLSQGQKTAVGLMLMSKLAEYAMQRDALRTMGSLSAARRRKAMAQSQSVMVFDGLFSNLTNPAIINEAMQSLKATKGNFQLIGLIHNPAYENDPEVFPSFISVQKMQEPSGGSGFLALDDNLTPVSPSQIGRRAGELEVAQYQYDINKEETLDE